VRTHELGFTGALARRLRGATQRGVVIRTDIDIALTAATAPAAIRATRTRFDELRIAVLGMTEILTQSSVANWRAEIEEVLDALEPAAGRPALLVGLQPISSIPVYRGGLSHWLDRQAAAMNRASQDACAARPHAAFVDLPAPPSVPLERYRGPADYDFWAQRVVEAAAPLLGGTGARTSPSPYDPTVERRREAELARLGITGQRVDLNVDSVVRFTRAVFDMSSADMLILGSDLAYSISSTAPERPEQERDRSFTAYAIESRGCFIVPDARADPRFRDHSAVTGDPGLVFFAAYPVEGPSGERIGALAVYDTVPREFDDTSQELLRVLAGQMEQVLRDSA
jgi:GAF domain-containing protein